MKPTSHRKALAELLCDPCEKNPTRDPFCNIANIAPPVATAAHGPAMRIVPHEGFPSVMVNDGRLIALTCGAGEPQDFTDPDTGVEAGPDKFPVWNIKTGEVTRG